MALAPDQVVILGCGYTGERVAGLLEAGGRRVLRTRREARPGVEPLEAGDAAAVERLRACIEPGARILHSLPLLQSEAGWRRPTPLIRPLLEGAARVVYLSTTGVYGAQTDIDERTPPAPRTPRERLRIEEETEISSGPWSTLILRPAAIYGPGRGVHVALAQRRHRLWGDGSNYISRIHVDDLAAIAAAALFASLEGAWPVADDHPCPAREITDYCARLLGIPPPLPAGAPPPEDTRGANRRVDGRAIRAALGVALRYPSYRDGIPAALRSATITEITTCSD